MEDRLSEDELHQRLIDAASKVQVGKQYRHYKGRLYIIRNIALMESTNQPAVMYQAEYGKKVKFIRPLDDWLASVEHQGKTTSRFQIVD